jgi:hypothetical protein
MPRVPRPSGKLTPKPLRPKAVPSTTSETERDNTGGPGIYHPDISPSPRGRGHGVGPFIKAYAIEGVMEFAVQFFDDELE